MKVSLIKIVPAALLLGATTCVWADVAFDSLSGGVVGSGWNVRSPTSNPGYQSVAEEFQSLSSGSLTTIKFASSYGSGAGTVMVGLYSDSGSDTVGTLLEAFNATVPVNSNTFVAILNSGGGVNLSTGDKYWLGFIAQDDTYIYLSNANPTVTGNLEFNYDTSGFSFDTSMSGFSVETQAVPEPTTLAAFGFGAGALLLRRRKRS